MVGSPIGINQLGDDMVEFVLISRKLCESYKRWFWLLWEKSIPFDKVKEAEKRYEKD